MSVVRVAIAPIRIDRAVISSVRVDRVDMSSVRIDDVTIHYVRVCRRHATTMAYYIHVHVAAF